MGVVYEAHHAVVRRRFAIKFLRRDLAERRDILTRFQREAEAAGALENENVAAAVDFGISDDGMPYIVMEYLVGESVGALLEREGCLPPRRACDLVAQACRGVEAAHAAGIVHRDLKPHNLFLCRRDDGTDLVKVLDFGVAKLQAIEAASAATDTGTMLGTTAYMSPEQARGEKMVDQRADVYALGAILYELLSQQKPHPGDSQNAILHHIATQPAGAARLGARGSWPPSWSTWSAGARLRSGRAARDGGGAGGGAGAVRAPRGLAGAPRLPRRRCARPGRERGGPAAADERARGRRRSAPRAAPLAARAGAARGQRCAHRGVGAGPDRGGGRDPAARRRGRASRRQSSDRRGGPDARSTGAAPAGARQDRGRANGDRRGACTSGGEADRSDVRPDVRRPPARGVRRPGPSRRRRSVATRRLPRSPEPTAAAPAFDAENPYK